MKTNIMIDYYHVHFFKIKTREIDIEKIFDFFDTIENISIESFDDFVEINYKVEELGINASFYFTKKSMVQDLTEINPKYLEIKFHLKLPILTNNYSAKIVFDLVRKLCDRFDFYVYNELFTDVMEYNFDTMMHAFNIMKSKYIEAFPKKLGNRIIVSSKQMNDILKYVDEKSDLEKYYRSDEILVPKYFFVKDKLDKLYTCIELKEFEKTVFPPRIDLIYYHFNNQVKIINYNLIIDKIAKYLSEVPGFIPGTKVLTLKKNKKVHKIIRKTKVNLTNQEFQLVDLSELIDL